MATEAQRKASAKYDKEHTKSMLFKFNTTNDADILAKLDEVGNKQGYKSRCNQEQNAADRQPKDHPIPAHLPEQLPEACAVFLIIKDT